MLEKLVVDLNEFLATYLPLLNSHNVDYLVKDHWNTYVPEFIRLNQHLNLYELYDEKITSENENLNEFIRQLINFRKRIEEITTDKNQFLENIQPTKSFKYANRTFMSLKKEHEVDILAPVIYQIAQISTSQSIIDFGSGRGYLGVQLAYNYNLPVLGIELNETTVDSAYERQKLLLKYQKEYSENKNYKSTSTLITSTTNFDELFLSNFHFSSNSFLLCGLHACGSLSASLIHHYLSKSHVHSLVNVACCYHLLEEKFCPNPFTNQIDPDGFPLSQILISKQAKLGRNARMLAVQSFERNRVDQEKNSGLWYRAIFQVMLIETFGLTKDCEVGKMKKNISSFEEYVTRAMKRLQLDSTKITKELIDEYEQRFANQREQMNCFIQLKVLFSYLIEMLILLDRLLFIREQSPTSSHSYLVPLFDPIQSPRRWCLISYK